MQHCNMQRKTLKNRIELASNSRDSATNKFITAIQTTLNEFMIDLAKKQIALAFQGAENKVKRLKERTKEQLTTISQK